MSAVTPLPDEYNQLTQDQLNERIAAAKEKLGESLVVLGHHYQSDAVIRFADFRGDSLKLARLAAEQHKARYIVFCGVHFMAESADILSGDGQAVVLPNLAAGCAMAAMADDENVSVAMDELSAGGRRVIPVTYVNSTAAVKAITGRAGGTCCTSSNVRNVFEWALAAESDGGAEAEVIFAVPDQHLGRNTALAMGIPEEQIVLYDPAMPGGGLSEQQLRTARVVLWKGHCYVHQLFTPEHVRAVRTLDPQMQVIVHPECPREVVDLADAAGSTSQIIQAVSEAPAGAKFAIGTESNLVQRLAAEHPDKTIRVLSQTPAVCIQMQRITLPHLAWALEELTGDRLVNRITVPESDAADARKALEQMISIKAVQGITRK
ncbi:MAG: quinolinate synthase NadA [Phycisphaerae bacterium]